MKLHFGFMIPLMAVCCWACGNDENEEPGNTGPSDSSSSTVLTIDGEKWTDPKITVYDESAGNYYFTYMAFDYTNGTRNFDFHVDSDYFEEAGEDIAEEIEIDKMGDIGNITLYEMDTEYISGKVIVESIGNTSIVLNFKNYECYYYPENSRISSEYKHKINGKVKFTLDGE